MIGRSTLKTLLTHSPYNRHSDAIVLHSTRRRGPCSCRSRASFSPVRGDCRWAGGRRAGDHAGVGGFTGTLDDGDGFGRRGPGRKWDPGGRREGLPGRRGWYGGRRVGLDSPPRRQRHGAGAAADRDRDRWIRGHPRGGRRFHSRWSPPPKRRSRSTTSSARSSPRSTGGRQGRARRRRTSTPPRFPVASTSFGSGRGGEPSPGA